MTKLALRTLTDQAYDQIREGLTSGQFAPGQPLVIRALAESYGISATPVREALQRLVAERLLEARPNRTIIVPVLTPDTYAELVAIRATLEGMATAQAATRATGADVARIAALLDDIDASIAARDTGAYLAQNRAFHFAVYDLSGSAELVRIIQDLWVRVGSFFAVMFLDPAYAPLANDEHRAVLAALAAGDGAAAAAAMGRDIAAASAAILPRLGSADAD